MQIHLDAKDGRIWMASPVRGDMINRVKAVPGSGLPHSEKYIEWGREVLKRGGVVMVATYQLNYRTCLDIRAEFDDCDIVIHPGLWKWAAEEKQKRADLLEIMKLEDYPLPVVERTYPRLAAALHNRPFQAVGVAYAVRGGQTVNGDDAGLGKTLQAIGAMVEAEITGPIVVIAPAVATVVTWPDEFDEWVPGEEYVVAEGSKEERDAALAGFWAWADARKRKRSWLFINIEMLQVDRPPVRRRQPKALTDGEWLGEGPRKRDEPELTPMPGSPAEAATVEYKAAMDAYDPSKRRHPLLFDKMWSSAIIDEGQRVLPTQASKKAKQSQTRSGAQELPVRPSGLKLVLSGSPMRGNPLNFWGFMNWLAPEQHPGFWAHVDRFFEVWENQERKMVESVRESAEVAYGAELDATMIRRTKAEVAPWLPAKEYGGTHLDPGDKSTPIGVWLDMEGRQKKAYEEMVENAVANLDSGQIMAQGILAEIMRSKQMACSFGDVESVCQKPPNMDYWEWVERYSARLPSNKWDWLTDVFLQERGIWTPKEQWGDGKVVIGSWQSGLLRLFGAELTRYKVPFHIITGGTSNTDRARQKQAFQRPGGARLFLLNTWAGGVSLTLDAADDMAIIDETWQPDDQSQLEDRIHRISRKVGRPPASYWYIRSRGTIDEHIARTTESKDRIQKRLMDGRRGVEYAKQLLSGG